MKIFCTGLSRTGTKSLTRALRQLGFHIVHYPEDSVTALEVIAGKPYSLLREYDGITDLHSATRFEQLDREYPGSRFIHTVRGKEGWLESCRQHFQRYRANPEPQPRRTMDRTLHLKAYGSDTFDAARFSDAYDRHSERVIQYFRDGNNLLLMDITAGDGWDLLCPFLDRSIHEYAFPKTR
jgi:hypothetical protein